MERTNHQLEVNEDMTLQRRMWNAERIGWILMFLFLVAAVLGYMGRGGLLVSERNAGGPNMNLEATYEPYLRQEVTTKLSITFHKSGTEQKLQLEQSLLDKIRITDVIPQPASTKVTETGIEYTFDATGSQSKVVLYFEPQTPGSLHTKLSSGSYALSFNQFVYP